MAKVRSLLRITDKLPWPHVLNKHHHWAVIMNVVSAKPYWLKSIYIKLFDELSRFSQTLPERDNAYNTRYRIKKVAIDLYSILTIPHKNEI